MSCPFCGCKEVHPFDETDDRLQRCAVCCNVFDLDDHADEDEDEGMP